MKYWLWILFFIVAFLPEAFSATETKSKVKLTPKLAKPAMVNTSEIGKAKNQTAGQSKNQVTPNAKKPTAKKAIVKTPNAKEIITTGETHLRGKSSQATMHMFIKRSNYSRALTLRSWARGSERALVEILEPAKEEGVASLRVENQMWNYLPKTDQVVRVPTSLMLQSWMGSDFTNDDLMKASSLSRDYKHKILRTEMIGKLNTYVIECVPKKNAPVVWGKVIHWAREKDSLPVKQQYFDDQKKLVRTVSYAQYKKMDDRIVPSVMRIVRADNKNEATAIVYDKLYYNREIPDRVFDKDSIRSISQRGKSLTAGWFLQPRHTGDE